MNIIEITIIILFSLGIFGLTIIFFLRRKQIKLINISIVNEMKKTWVFTFFTILFFSIVLSTIIGGFSANDKYINEFNSTVLRTAMPTEAAFVSNVSTYDYDETKGESKPVNPQGYETLSATDINIRVGKPDDSKLSKTRSIDYEAAWCRSLVKDNKDIYAPKGNGDYYSPSEVVNGYPSYLDSNWIYRIEDINSNFDLSYLYCLDYQLAKNTIYSNKELSSNANNYNLSYSFTTLINLSTINPDTGEKVNVQVNMMPDENIFNTFESVEGEKYISSFIDSNDNVTNNLDKNEAFMIYNNSIPDSLLKSKSVELSFPDNNYRVNKYIKDIINDFDRSYTLKIKDVGKHAMYLNPVDFTTNYQSLSTASNTEKDEGYLYLFVNEDTMKSLFETFLTKNINDLSTIIPEIFNIQSIKDGGGENKYGRDQLFVDFKFYLMNENIYNTALYNKDYIIDSSSKTLKKTNDYYSTGIYGNQEYYYNGKEIKETSSNDIFAFNSNNTTYYSPNIIDNNSKDFNIGSNDTYFALFQPNYSGNNNFYLFTTNYSSYSTTINIFLFAFIFLGIIVSIAIINKTFRNNKKQIGILKAIGYSRTSVSLSISNKVLFTLLISLIVSIVILPGILSFWQISLASGSLINLGLFTISTNAAIYGILLTFGSFWIFSFVLLRFFYLSKDSLDLIKEKNSKLTNIVISNSYYIDRKLSFSKKLLLNENLKSISKSFVLLLSSVSISFFALMAFSSQNILDSTLDSIDEQLPKKLLYLYNNNENNYTSITYEEFDLAKENKEITEYKFTETNNYEDLNWNQMSKGEYEESFKATFNDYYNKTQVNVENLKYISNETISNMLNIVRIGENLGAFNNKGDDSFLIYSFIKNIEDIYPFTVLKDQNNIELEDDRGFWTFNFDYEYGITLGFQVYDLNDKVPLLWATGVDMLPKNKSLSTSSSGINVPTLFIDLNYIKYFTDILYTSNVTIEMEINLTGNNDWVYFDNFKNDKEVDEFINNWEDMVNPEPDGKVPFYVTQANLGFAEISPTEELNTDIVYEMSLDKSLFTDTDDDGSILDENTPGVDGDKWKFDIDFVYKGVVGTSIPFLGPIIPINDPDLLMNTQIDSNGNFSFEDGPSLVKYNTSNLGFNKTIGSNIFEFSVVGNKVFISRNDINKDYYSLSFKSSRTNNKEIKDKFYNSNSKLEDITTYQGRINKVYADNLSSPYALNNFNPGGIGIEIVPTFQSISEPEIKSIQDSISIYSVFAILIIVALIMVIILDLINNNKKNNLFFKTIGYSNFRVTFNSFASYLFIFIIGFAISIPLFSLFGSFVGISVPLIIEVYPIVISPKLWNYLVALAIILVTFVLSATIGYIYNQQIKPAKNLNK